MNRSSILATDVPKAASQQ